MKLAREAGFMSVYTMKLALDEPEPASSCKWGLSK